MRSIIITIIILITAGAYGQNHFEKKIDIGTDASAEAIIPTGNGNFVLAGTAKVNTVEKAIVMRLNAKGDTIWYSNNLFAKTSKAYDVIENQDGDLVVSGTVLNGYEKAFIAKLDATGTVLWTKTHSGSTSFSAGYAIAESGSGGYVIAGANYTSTHGNDFYIIKTDSVGDTIWTRNVGGPGDEVANSIMVLGNGEIIAGGYTQSYGAGGYDGYLVKLSSTGSVLWTKTYGKLQDDYLYAAKATADQGFLLCGKTKSFGNNDQYYLVKTDAAGDTLWTNVFGGNGTDIATGCGETQDGGYLVSGYSNKFNPAGNDYLMIKTDAGGKKQWEKFYGYPSFNTEFTNDLEVLLTGEMILCGYTQPSTGHKSIYVVKTDMNGCSPHFPEIQMDNVTSYFTFCEGNPAKLYLQYAYQNYQWSNGDPGDFINVDVSGDYFVQVTDFNGCDAWSDTVSLTKLPKPVLKLKSAGPDIFCPGTFDTITLYATSGYTGYMWNTSANDTLPVLVANKLGKYNVTVTDTNGCTNTASILLRNYAPYNGEKICVVTVDSFTNKNLIAWERTGGKNTDFYKIYRETTQAGVYAEIGKQPFNKTSVFVDYGSNPKVKSDRYKITVVDSCGTESDLASAPFHKTMHLTANKGTANEINLIWEHYEGLNFQTYKIYRGTNPSNLQLLDSIQSTNFTYTDQNPPTSTAVYYQVSIVMPDTCTPTIIRAQTTSGPFSQSLSNLKDYGTSRPDYLTVTPQTQFLYYGNDDATFNVYTNLADWDVSSTASWVTLTVNKTDGFVDCHSDVNFGSNSRTADITFTASGMDPVTVQLVQDPVSGIQPVINEPEIVIYPNPAKENLNIDIHPEKNIRLKISFYNMLGEESLVNIDEYIPVGRNHFETNTSGLINNTVYFVRIQMGNKIFIRKFLKL